MPYVAQEKRRELDKLIKIMLDDYMIRANGDLNYVLYAYCKRHITPSYNNYKSFIGELNECAREIGRRLLAEYEDKKRDENGDVE